MAKIRVVARAQISEQATAVTPSARIQAILTPTSPEARTQNTVKTTDQSARQSTSTSDCGSQQSIDTAEGSTQHSPQQTRSSSHTIQEFDIGQRDVDIGVIPPHVDDRRVQMLEQVNEAWLRGRALEQLVAGRRNRLLLEHSLELAKRSMTHEEDKDKAIRAVLQNANQIDILRRTIGTN